MSHAYPLDAVPATTEAEARALVGGKAANLAVMSRDLGLPVPPGFVITTTTCREFLATGWPDGLDAELRERMAEVEAAVGRRFGDANDPLLVSVRSGAPVSMPGMMDTILDLGLNDATTAGLGEVTGDEAFARSCRDRLEIGFRTIVGVADVPDDPWQQLRLAVEAVFRSWESDRAVTYRRREGIADDLGTAVTIQAMVFGNRGPDSATGVLFTRDPATGEHALYGDILFDAQGEDVVAGTHATQPIAALAGRLPAVAAELERHAERLEHHFADMCDIEFTIEDARLWMLQVRVGKRSPQAALRIAVDMATELRLPADAGPGRRARPAVAGRSTDHDHWTRSLGRGARDRSARVARDGQRADRARPGRRHRRRRRRHAGHPRARRDLARRRPRHGPGGRDPDVPRRPRQSCGRRGAWLGHPGRGRRGGCSARRRPRHDQRPNAGGRHGHHHRWQLGRGIRGRRRVDDRGRPGGEDPARLGGGARHQGRPRKRGFPSRRGHVRSGRGAWREPPRHPRPLPRGDRDQGVRAAAGGRRRRSLHRRHRAADRRPARRRRTRAGERRRVPADRRRDDSRRRPHGRRSSGARTGDRRQHPRRLSCSSTSG